MTPSQVQGGPLPPLPPPSIPRQLFLLLLLCQWWRLFHWYLRSQKPLFSVTYVFRIGKFWPWEDTSKMNHAAQPRVHIFIHLSLCTRTTLTSIRGLFAVSVWLSVTTMCLFFCRNASAASSNQSGSESSGSRQNLGRGQLSATGTLSELSCFWCPVCEQGVTSSVTYDTGL